MVKEFREFILRGNVIDLAIGVVIGAAFSAIVTSLVNDIIMPPIGMITGGVNFADLFLALDGKDYDSLAVAQEAGAPTLNYGLFVMTIINFIIIALVIFLVVKGFNRIRREQEEEAAEPDTQACPYCLTDIPVKASRCPNCTSQLEMSS